MDALDRLIDLVRGDEEITPEFRADVRTMLENTAKYEKEHPESVLRYEEPPTPEQMFIDGLKRLRKVLFIPTPCTGCKNNDGCSYNKHPELLVSRIINESTGRYTCYEEKEDD